MLSDLQSFPGVPSSLSLKKIHSNIEITTTTHSPLSSLLLDAHLGSILIDGMDDQVSVRLDLYSGPLTDWVKDVALKSLRRLSVDPSCVDKAD